MTRKYTVNIVDKNGNLIMQFIGTVTGKEQSSGRLGGPVVETLITSSARFYDRTGTLIKINKAKKQT